MRKAMSIRPALILLFAGLAVAPALAQNSAIQGQVSDPQGAAIPGAQVVVTNLATGVSIHVLTNQSGLYSAPDLLAGEYRVEASKQGFGTALKNNIRLNVTQTIQLNFALKLGQVTQTIQVKEAGEVLNTETTTVGQLVSNRQVVQLPLNGRNYLQLALLTAGTAPAYGSRGESNGSFTATGQDSYQMNIILDGARNNTIFSGGQLGYEAQAVAPPPDAINEFEVVTNNNSAEYGVRMGGTVIASIKSGTDQFHGDAWEFVRNDAFDAANFFASGQPKPTLRQNQFGGTFGGPIVKNNTFFFVSYQGTRIHSGSSAISTLPTMAERSGDFSGQKTIYDPATTRASGKTYTRTPFANNMIPASRFDPVAVKVIGLYPQPNLPGSINNYFFSGNGYDDTDEVDSRLDHNFTSSERAYVRYSRRSESTLDPGGLPLPADGGHWETVGLTAHNGVIGLTSTISPTLVNDMTASLEIFNTIIDIPWTTDPDEQLGIKGVPDLGYPNQHGMTLFNPTGYSEVGAQAYWPNNNNLDEEEISDNLLWSHGRHMIKTGFEFFRDGTNRLSTRFGRGQMNFNGDFTQNPQSRATTGNAMADFLLGDASGGTIGNFLKESLIAPNWSAFVQDDWQVNTRLTLNLGVRWDLFHPPTYRDYQSMSRFDPFPGTPDYNQFEYPTGNGDCGCTVNWHNFAPRLGFAYQIMPKTVVRSGFGIYYGMTDSYDDIAERYHNEAPSWTEISFPTDQLFQPALIVSQGFPPNLVPTTVLQKNVGVSASYPTMPDQYAMEWFLDVQRELGPSTVLTVGYLGSGTRHLTENLNLNQPFTPAAGAVQSRRPFPAFSSIGLADPMGDASYHALTVKFEKRYSQGLSLLAAYTYSHAIDDVTEYDNTAQGQGLENNYDLGTNWGNSVFDRRQIFVASGIYDLPFGAGRRFMNRRGVLDEVLGGWRVGGIWTIESGPPFTPVLSTDVTNVGQTSRPNVIGNANLPGSQRSINDWFNLGAFQIPAQYTYGNGGRDILYGPGLVNIDLNLSKDFAITESKRLEFRAEAFDLTNTPHFDIPNASVDLPQAGTITSAEAPREIQLALKFIF